MYDIYIFINGESSHYMHCTKRSVDALLPMMDERKIAYWVMGW